ncbi:hypothetical protein HID58_062981 [Brassica napus]|uniref:EF-hand domain-containing protein n=1 Tax=Brassica napus TaxID=3708 RepID=A0ABQ8A468_BRANA|nr:hypothetical protein HID58_062981 [Brassica napus]
MVKMGNVCIHMVNNCVDTKSNTWVRPTDLIMDHPVKPQLPDKPPQQMLMHKDDDKPKLETSGEDPKSLEESDSHQEQEGSTSEEEEERKKRAARIACGNSKRKPHNVKRLMSAGLQAESVIVERLSEEEIHSLRATFKTIDSEKSGRVTYKELKNVLERFNTNLDNSDISGLMQTPMNEHLEDTVDYEEFIAAVVRLKELKDEEANDRLDSSTKVEKSRRVTYKELKSILESFDTNLDNSDISGLMQTPMNEHLKDTVDYEEFIAAIVRLKELQDEEANDRLDSSTKEVTKGLQQIEIGGTEQGEEGHKEGTRKNVDGWKDQ